MWSVRRGISHAGVMTRDVPYTYIRTARVLAEFLMVSIGPGETLAPSDG